MVPGATSVSWESQIFPNQAPQQHQCHYWRDSAQEAHDGQSDPTGGGLRHSFRVDAHRLQDELCRAKFPEVGEQGFQASIEPEPELGARSEPTDR